MGSPDGAGCCTEPRGRCLVGGGSVPRSLGRGGSPDGAGSYNASSRFEIPRQTRYGSDRAVSRYFRYKTSQDLIAGAKALGLDVELSDDLSPLFAPIDVAGRRIGNRLAIQPMEGCDGETDGSPGELTLRRYRRFGAGGAKLIWGEACAVVSEGRANPRQLVINCRNAGPLARLVRIARDAHRESNSNDDDLLVGLQLTHSGRYSFERPLLAQHDPLLDPRTVIDKKSGATAGPDNPLLSDAELDVLQDRYVDAAILAFQAGFDFVDIKQCHRYLLNELLAAQSPWQIRRAVRAPDAVCP